MITLRRILLLSFLCLSYVSIPFSKLYASTNLTSEYLKNVKEQILLLDENIDPNELIFDTYLPLYDINNDENYTLIQTGNHGYIISNVNNGAISEFSLANNSNPYEKFMDKMLYYYGPLNYIYKDGNTMIDINSKEPVTNSKLRSDDNLIELQDKNRKFLNEVPPISGKTRATASWRGISETRFSRYNGTSWRNTSNVCGPIAASIMLAYYDDYIGYDLIPDSIRKVNSTSPGSLITKMISETPFSTNTIPNFVSTGISGFISKYSPNKYVKPTFTLTNPFSTVANECSTLRPICVGLLNSNGSSYGNHWVTVYQYYETGIYTGYYKCIDNWGFYNKQISSSWAMGAVKVGY
ncbi:cysteine peptidase [Amedibacillus sp. YH-ame6]